ncbi:hypothetical protein ScPMuIL_006835 [Solemya velum]
MKTVPGVDTLSSEGRCLITFPRAYIIRLCLHETLPQRLLILRGYISHPTKWEGGIIQEVKENMNQLPPAARELYVSGTVKQFRDRMSTKLGKLEVQ